MEIQLPSEAEERGDRNGKVAAGIGFILFVVAILVPIFYKLNPPPGQPGIAVLLAFDDQGSGDNPAGPSAPAEPVTKPEPVKPPPPAPEVKPDPVPEPPKPTTTPKPVVEQRDVIQEETAQEIAIRKRKAQEEARKREEERLRKEKENEVRRREDAAAQAAQEQAAKERREQEAREAAIREANAKAEAERQAREARAQALRDQLSGGLSGSGSGSGNTGTPGTQGRPDGVADGEGIVAGSGRVSGGLGGRGLLSSPPVKDALQRSGTVVLSVCVGQDGKIASVDFTQAGSINANTQLINAAKANARKWRFKADPTAPATQCGKITYKFKVQ